MVESSTLGDSLDSPPPQIDEAAAVVLLREAYGVEAEAKALACERDATFRINAATGDQFTLKVSNPAEPALDTNFQTEAILWLEERDPGLPVPKIVRDREGRSEFQKQMPDGRTSIIRLLTWVAGVPVAQIGVSASLRRDMGRILARLGQALRDFDHPSSSHHVQWDIKHASRLRPLIASLQESPIRQQMIDELDHFDTAIVPLLAVLRQQVVHNDFNLHNVLVDPNRPQTVSGVLDFGDMVRTPLIIDLAVAASYMAHRADGPLEAVAEIVSAYHAVTPLHPLEVGALRDLIVARLVTTIAITEWRAARYPQNAEYILRNNPAARVGMAHFAAMPRTLVTQALLHACNME